MLTVWFKRIGPDQVEAVVAKKVSESWSIIDIITGKTDTVRSLLKSNFPTLASYAQHNAGRPVVYEATTRSYFNRAMRELS